MVCRHDAEHSQPARIFIRCTLWPVGLMIAPGIFGVVREGIISFSNELCHLSEDKELSRDYFAVVT